MYRFSVTRVVGNEDADGIGPQASPLRGNGLEKRSFFCLSKFWTESAFSPWTLKPSDQPPRTPKTGRRTSLSGFEGGFIIFLMFILTEFLKNHSKSQKNYKIKNLIFLNSTWVDIRSEHIIWYTLVQIFCYIFIYILFCN